MNTVNTYYLLNMHVSLIHNPYLHEMNPYKNHNKIARRLSSRDKIHEFDCYRHNAMMIITDCYTNTNRKGTNIIIVIP